MPFPARSARGGIAAILVTGFLGSGKTTFILRSLAPRMRGRRFAVLVNDFGAINFDGRILSTEGLDVVEVEGGCICCSVGDQFLAALARIRERVQPDWLVVEGSGLADPRPIIEALESLDFVLQGVVCAFGATTPANGFRYPVVASQVAAAHAVVLTRVDVASPEVVEAAAGAVRRLTAAPVFLGREGEADESLWQVLTGEPAPVRSPRIHRHGPRIAQSTIHPAGFFRKADLQAWLQALPPTTLRVKGVVQCVESPVPLGVNWVGGYLSWHRVEQDNPAFLVAIVEGDPASALSGLPATLPGHLPDVADRDMMPDGEWDARDGVAYVSGRPGAEIDVIHALADSLARGAAQTLMLASPDLPLPNWSSQLQSVVPLVDQDYASLRNLVSRIVGHSPRQILAWNIRSAVAGWLGRELRSIPLLHVGEAYGLPGVALSIRVRDATQRQVLARYIGVRIRAV